MSTGAPLRMPSPAERLSSSSSMTTTATPAFAGDAVPATNAHRLGQEKPSYTGTRCALGALFRGPTKLGYFRAQVQPAPADGPVQDSVAAACSSVISSLRFSLS